MVIVMQPRVLVDLKLLYRQTARLPEGLLEELVQHRPVKPLREAVSPGCGHLGGVLAGPSGRDGESLHPVGEDGAAALIVTHREPQGNGLILSMPFAPFDEFRAGSVVNLPLQIPFFIHPSSISILQFTICNFLQPAGSSNQKRLPCPGTEATSIRLPKVFMHCWTRASPRPVPPSSRLRALSMR